MSVFYRLTTELLEHIYEECADIRDEKERERERIKRIQTGEGCNISQSELLRDELLDVHSSWPTTNRLIAPYKQEERDDARRFSMVNRSTHACLVPSLREFVHLTQKADDDEWVNVPNIHCFGPHAKHLRISCADFSETRQMGAIEALSLCTNLRKLSLGVRRHEIANTLHVDSPFIHFIGNILQNNKTITSILLSFVVTASALKVLLRALASGPPICECALDLTVVGVPLTEGEPEMPLEIQSLKTFVGLLRDATNRRFDKLISSEWSMPNLVSLSLGEFDSSIPFDSITPSFFTIMHGIPETKYTFRLPFSSVTHLAVPYWLVPLIDDDSIPWVTDLTILGKMALHTYGGADEEGWYEDALLDTTAQVFDRHEEIVQRYEHNTDMEFHNTGFNWFKPPTIFILAGFLCRILEADHQHDHTPLLIHLDRCQWDEIRVPLLKQFWLYVDAIKDLINEKGHHRTIAILDNSGRPSSFLLLS